LGHLLPGGAKTQNIISLRGTETDSPPPPRSRSRNPRADGPEAGQGPGKECANGNQAINGKGTTALEVDGEAEPPGTPPPESAYSCVCMCVCVYVFVCL